MRLARLFASLLVIGALSACHRNKDAEGPMERAGKGVDNAAEETGEALKTAAEKTGEAADKAAHATGEAFEKAGKKLKGDAGAPSSPNAAPASSGAPSR